MLRAEIVLFKDKRDGGNAKVKMPTQTSALVIPVMKI